MSLLIDLQRKNGANEYDTIIALVKIHCYHFFVRVDHSFWLPRSIYLKWSMKIWEWLPHEEFSNAHEAADDFAPHSGKVEWKSPSSNRPVERRNKWASRCSPPILLSLLLKMSFFIQDTTESVYEHLRVYLFEKFESLMGIKILTPQYRSGVNSKLRSRKSLVCWRDFIMTVLLKNLFTVHILIWHFQIRVNYNLWWRLKAHSDTARRSATCSITGQ